VTGTGFVDGLCAMANKWITELKEFADEAQLALNRLVSGRGHHLGPA